jgi:two-component system KDP operon response regulator KdpE
MIRKILLVDDDPWIRTIYSAALAVEGYQVSEAEEWDEATSFLAQHPDTDLVLLDIQMPAVSGDELFGALRLYNPKMRIIVFSVYSIDEQQRLIFKADDYFDKADGVNHLLSKIKRMTAESLIFGENAGS